jgi:hypothetical protein
MNCRGRALGGSNLSADLFSCLQVFLQRPPTASWEVSSPQARKRPSGRERSAKWFSPDEIATLIALDGRAKKIAAVKAVFPGAEIGGRSLDPSDRPGEGLTDAD